MKESLTKLLFEEYKQICLFNDLEKSGIEMTNITVNNSDIVYDLIGFPKDNTLDYDMYAMNGFEHNPENGLEPDDNMFCRDWLHDKYYDIINSIDKIQKIEVTDKGLKMTEHDDEKLIKERLNEFVEWLFIEYEKLK
jgi:hypothetical protein